MSVELLDLPDLPAGSAAAARTIVAVPGAGTAPATPYKAPLTTPGTLPIWTTSTRPTLSDGQAVIGYNTAIPQLEAGIGVGGLQTWTALGGGASSTVPAYPNLTVTPGNGQNTIAWTDGSTGGSPITGHKLYRSTSPGAEALLGTITTASPYVDTGLTNGTAYYYRLSATNAVGEGAQSAEVSATPALPVASPVNTVLPAVSGTAQQGQTLSVTTGTWSGTPTPTYAYQWLRAGAAISGATGSTYLLGFGDVGSAISCAVTATNAAGSASATSPSTATVTPIAATITGTAPAGTVGTAYSYTFTTANFVGAITATVGSGTLPAGLALSVSGSSIVLSGTPTAAATSSFTIHGVGATSGTADSAAQSVTIAAAVVSTHARFAQDTATAGAGGTAAALFASMAQVSGASSDRTGTITTTADPTKYTWVAVTAAAAGSGVRFFDGTGYGGFNGAGSSSIYTGPDADPTTIHQTYTDGSGNTWNLYRSSGHSVALTFTLS